jgi:hypothetical protein
MGERKNNIQEQPQIKLFEHMPYLRINTKTRYNLIKTIKQFYIPMEQQPSKFIEDFPNTNHIMHFPTKNRERTRPGQTSDNFAFLK